MPIYEITDPKNSKVLEFEGPTPPDQRTIMEAFSRASFEVSKQAQPEADNVPQWGRENPNLYGVAGAAKETLKAIGRPVAQGVGLAGGALAGAPLGPAGMAVGAGLGYAGVNRLLKTADAMSGGPTETLPEAFTATGKDVAEGAAMEAGGQVAGKAIQGAVTGAGKVIKPVLGRLSSTGTAAVEEAIKSGKSTGLPLTENPLAAKTAFDKALRGKITPEEVVSNAKSSLNELKMQRSADYQQKLAEIGKNTKQIDLTPLHNKMNGLMSRYNVRTSIVKGKIKVDTSRIAMGKTGRNDIEDIVETIASWGKQPNDKTAIGLDTLKRQLDDFYSDSSQAREFVTSLNNEVKKIINTAVPEYGKMTKGYAEATSLIKDIESGLMLRKQGMTGRIVADQSLRRLISTMKDNKELSRDLVTILGNKTNADLTGQIAGTAMSAPLPSGLAGNAPIAIGGAAALSSLNPSFLPVIAASSPRIQGEFLRLFGKLSAEFAGTQGAIGRTAVTSILEQKKKAIERSNIPDSDKKRFLDNLIRGRSANE